MENGAFIGDLPIQIVSNSDFPSMTMLVYQRLSIDQRLSVDALINGNPQPGSAIRPSKSTFGCGSKLIDLPEQKLSMTYVYIDYM